MGNTGASWQCKNFFRENNERPQKASEQDHITRKEFLLQFFGPFKRDLGNPERFLTDNPNDILEFIENCPILDQKLS